MHEEILERLKSVAREETITYYSDARTVHECVRLHPFEIFVGRQFALRSRDHAEAR